MVPHHWLIGSRWFKTAYYSSLDIWPSKIRPLCCLEMTGANHPVTWCHIPEQILQLHHSKNRKTRIVKFLSASELIQYLLTPINNSESNSFLRFNCMSYCCMSEHHHLLLLSFVRWMTCCTSSQQARMASWDLFGQVRRQVSDISTWSQRRCRASLMEWRRRWSVWKVRNCTLPYSVPLFNLCAVKSCFKSIYVLTQFHNIQLLVFFTILGGNMQFSVASDNLEKKTTVIREVILVVIEAWYLSIPYFM